MTEYLLTGKMKCLINDIIMHSSIAIFAVILLIRSDAERNGTAISDSADVFMTAVSLICTAASVFATVRKILFLKDYLKKDNSKVQLKK